MTNASNGHFERFLLILLLANLAIAQPLFDLFGRQAEFLVAHSLLGWRLVAFGIALGLVLPLLIAGIAPLASRVNTGLGRVVFYLLFGALVMLILAPLLNRAGGGGWTALLALLALALGVLLAHRRFRAVRQFFAVFALAVPVLLLWFLFNSRATPLLASDTPPQAGPALVLDDAPDIVFLMLDEFPLVSLLTADLEIDRQRFPNFAWLAEHSNWYLDAATGAEVTVDAVPEALTGLAAQPDSEVLPISLNHPRNLFTLLGDHYRITAFETATLLCPRALCSGHPVRAKARQAPARLTTDLALVYAHIVTPHPWVERLPSVSDGWAGFLSEQAPAQAPDGELELAFAKAGMARQMGWETRGGQFREFISRIHDGERPGLHYLHSLLPHRVWRYLPDGRQYLVEEVWAALDPPAPRPMRFDDQIFGHKWQPDVWAVQMARQRHLLQVQYLDGLLGELLDHMRRQGLLADSLLIVTGDHGASFLPGEGRRAITHDSLTDISAVPLFIKLPGQQSGQTLRRQARLVDILPTVLETLGIDPGWPMDGHSLLDPERPVSRWVNVKNANGETLSYPRDEHLQHLRARAAQHERVFGQGTAFVPRGPHASLVGQAIAELNPGQAATGRVVLDAPQLFQDVDPAGNFVPAHVTGRLVDTDLSGGAHALALGLQGKIVAVTRTYTVPGFEDRFEAIIDPDYLLAGENRLQFYLVYGSGERAFLSPLSTGELTNAHLIRRGDQEFVTGPADTEWPVLNDAGAGQVITTPVEGGGVVMLNGSVASDAPAADQLFAFLDGRFAGSAAAQDGLFRIPLASRGPDGDLARELRVFKIGPGGARESKYPPACSPDWHFAPPPGWAGINCLAEAENPFTLESGALRARLDFTVPTIRPYLKGGWQAETGNASWTIGQQADLEIPLPDGLHTLRFTAVLKPFLAPPGLAAQRVFVLVNGENVAALELGEDEFTEVHWEVPAATLARDPESAWLTFLTPDAASPRSLGVGEDLRILGLAVARLKIEAIPYNPTRALSEPGGEAKDR